MSNAIGQSIAAIVSLIVLYLAFALFDPIVRLNLYPLVLTALSGGSATLAINKGSLLLTANIILMGFKVFAFFVIFAVFSRLFLYLGFLTEERSVM